MSNIHLVLDVDQTLIHCIQRRERPNGPGWHAIHLPMSTCEDLDASYYWFQVRPGALQFLHTARTLFDIRIYSLGQRRYVEAVLAELAPWIPLHHIWTRSDQNDELSKHLSRLGLSSANAVIVDDCPGVWCTEDVENVIAVKPYLSARHSDDRWLLRVVLPQLLTMLHENTHMHTPLTQYLMRARGQTFALTSILFVTDEICYEQCRSDVPIEPLPTRYMPLGRLQSAMREAIRHGSRCFVFAPRLPIREFSISSSTGDGGIGHHSQSMDLQSFVPSATDDEWNDLESCDLSSLNSQTLMAGEFVWSEMTHAVFDPTQPFEVPWEALALHRQRDLHFAPIEWLQDSCCAWTELDTDAYLREPSLCHRVTVRS